jgi:hypothetical protein
MIPTMRLVINGSPLRLDFFARPNKEEHEDEKADGECDKKQILHKSLVLESEDHIDPGGELAAIH